MSVHGIGRGSDIPITESEAPEKAEAANVSAPEVKGAPLAAAPGAGTAAKAGALPSRMDVQRLLLEKSMAAAKAAPVDDHAKLRAAFDAIDVPASAATTYRMDRNVDAFASRWKTLEGAKKSFDTTYFFWDDDVFGYAMLGQMMKKAKEGVSIRAMMDDTGSRGGKGLHGTGRDEDLLQELVNIDPKKVQIGVFNPMLRKNPTSIESLVSSNHDKLAIADGQRFETGGRNIGTDYFSDPKDVKGVFRDCDMHIESAVAAKSATKAFETEFKDDNTYKIKPDKFGNWKKHDAELMGAYSMMDYWLKQPPLSEAEKTEIRAGGPAAQKRIDEVLNHALADLPNQGVTRKPSSDEMKKLQELAKQLVANTEVRGTHDTKRTSFDTEVKLLDKTAATTEVGAKNEISDSLVSLIENAHDSITIHNPYVVMTDRGLDALAAAGKRGVKIDIITNSPVSTDSTETQAFFLQDWPLILAKVPNAHIYVATGEQKHHAKTFVIDDVVTGVSTYNADWISARVNSEDVALNWSEKFASDTLKSYKDTLASPEHKFVEYKIKRDADGKALVKDGKPIVEFGPQNHCPKEMLDSYKKRIAVWSFARDHLDALAPLRRPKLDPAKDPIHVIP